MLCLLCKKLTYKELYTNLERALDADKGVFSFFCCSTAYIRHLLYIFHFHLGMGPSLPSVMKVVQLVLKCYYLEFCIITTE